jgi:GTP diphosphokinase / guanosine-3',5'-bis(diphosphate) 3'-diphosphatase
LKDVSLLDGDQCLLERPYDRVVQEDFENLLELARSYDPELDSTLIRRAFDYASLRHVHQTRRSGEPYILHPIAVATILTELQMHESVLAAALLHDVIEDCGVTVEDLTEEFGAEIAQLVDGVTKLKLADFETTQGDLAATAALTPVTSKKHGEISRSAANLRKILLAMARDLRVMIIKLADRLHNMRTLSSLSPERQQRVSKETLQIFAPLAHRLGIWQIKWQLEDLAFKYLQPTAYAELSDKLNQTREQREKDIANAIEILRRRLLEEGIIAEVSGRPKHLYSIYNKMKKNGVDFADIFDLVALRIVVSSVADCYYALGIVHDQWLPVPNQFDDYIAKPKSNGYQSLHTKVVGPTVQPLEIQIRTREMHRLADFGVAAHWQYKEGGSKDKRFDRKMSLLRQQLFDWQSDSKDAGEFLKSVVDDLFTDQVFVFTPKGDVLDFPAGATPVDAAFRIHSDLGQRCVGAKVNGKIVSLSYQFQNGDIVDIIARPNANPSLDWLTFAKTSHARSKIKHYFRKQRFAQNVARGREMLQKEADRLRFDYHQLMAQDSFTKVRESSWNNFHTDEDLLAAIGYGDAPVGAVVQKLKALQPDQPKANPFSAILGKKATKNPKLQIGGDLEDIAIVRAKCCAPVPGDEVIGYMTRGKGIALHRQGCQNVTHYQQKEPDRLVEIDWQPKPSSEKPDLYLTDIKMELLDRVGLLEDVAKLFSEVHTNIQAIRTRSNLSTRTAMMQISFDALNTKHVADTMTRLSRLADVLDIHRVGPNEEPVE